jgi:hypothetical protein
MKAYKKTLLWALGLFILDAFVLSQGGVALVLILLVFVVFLPRALWVARKDPPLYRQRVIKAWIYLVAAILIFVSIGVQNRMADRRAIAIGKACLSFRAKYNRYPQTLQELVPEFMPSVPPARYSLGGHDSFIYIPRLDSREPMLFYEAVPPFGRKFYHMESGEWGWLD